MLYAQWQKYVSGRQKRFERKWRPLSILLARVGIGALSNFSSIILLF